MSCARCRDAANAQHARCGACGTETFATTRTAARRPALPDDGVASYRALGLEVELVAFARSARDSRRVRSVRDLPGALGHERRSHARQELRPAVVWGLAVAAAILLAGGIVLMAIGAHQPG